MIWHRLHDDAIESDAGYVITRNTRHDGTICFLTLLGRTAYGKVPQVLGGHDSSDEAKAHCENHYQSTKAIVS